MIDRSDAGQNEKREGDGASNTGGPADDLPEEDLRSREWESEDELDTSRGPFADDRPIAQQQHAEWEEGRSGELYVSGRDVRSEAVPADVTRPIAPRNEEDDEKPDTFDVATVRTSLRASGDQRIGSSNSAQLIISRRIDRGRYGR